MNVNATIILQAINFGIAYVLFWHILLKPAYAIIAGDDQKKERLEQLLIQDQERIDHQKQELSSLRRSNYLFFKQHIPEHVQSTIIEHNVFPVIELKPTDQKLDDELEMAAAQALIKAIGAYNDIR